jgi:hypothetical protein
MPLTNLLQRGHPHSRLAVSSNNSPYAKYPMRNTCRNTLQTLASSPILTAAFAMGEREPSQTLDVSLLDPDGVRLF